MKEHFKLVEDIHFTGQFYPNQMLTFLDHVLKVNQVPAGQAPDGYEIGLVRNDDIYWYYATRILIRSQPCVNSPANIGYLTSR